MKLLHLQMRKVSMEFGTKNETKNVNSKRELNGEQKCVRYIYLLSVIKTKQNRERGEEEEKRGGVPEVQNWLAVE